ncbi:MAG: RNA polymerase sigma factor, partial [Gammaproteobacteria bacterium]|nr:RNA polymerase sigma factor [Gammaproteobacteria bacterium]
QEVFVRGFKGLRSFRFRSAPFTWLYRTTRNVCNEFNRVRRSEPLDAEPRDWSKTPEGLVAVHEKAQRVREFVARLPERQREVVVLRIFEDLSVKEAAKLMGCREGTVKALLHKATASLRIAVDKAGIENE